MIEFIERPNLPQGKVHSVICGKTDRLFTDFLKERNIEIIFSDNNEAIDARVSNHADLSALHLGGNKIVLDKKQTALSSKLLSEGFDVILTDNDVSGKYPGDCRLNQILVGEYHIGRLDACDKNVFKNTELLRINTNQGYAKCSCLIVDDQSIITDDKALYSDFAKFGFNALLIDKGDISLSGYEYGFIGGASAKISKDEVLFFGDIRKHRSYNDIKNFLDKLNIKTTYIPDCQLTDIGGLVLLNEIK